MIETRTRGKGTIDRRLQGSVGTLADANPTRLSKRSQGCPLTVEQDHMVMSGRYKGQEGDGCHGHMVVS